MTNRDRLPWSRCIVVSCIVCMALGDVMSAPATTTSGSTPASSSGQVVTPSTTPSSEQIINGLIQSVGWYLRDHKFYSKDPRSNRQKVSKALISRFPSPPVDIDEEMTEACSDLISCLYHIDRKVQASPRYLKLTGRLDKKTRKRMKKAQYKWAPFDSEVELFNFRAAASYMMCYYTMRRERHLATFNSTCLLNNPDVRRSQTDFRSADLQPYQCAYLSFCPDPCCGSGAAKTPGHCWSRSENPCGDVGLGQCSVTSSATVTIDRLQLRGVKPRCHCPKEGYSWNDKIKMCIDHDECAAHEDTCGDRETCQNTLGGYTCVCQQGYYYRKTNTSEDCLEDFSGFKHLKMSYSPVEGIALPGNMQNPAVNQVLRFGADPVRYGQEFASRLLSVLSGSGRVSSGWSWITLIIIPLVV